MSSAIIYTSIPALLGSETTLQGQLDLMDVILVNMLTAINASALSGSYTEYKLDTGQTKSEIRFRTIDELNTAYGAMFKTQQMVLAQLNYNRTGRVFRMVQNKNFNGGGWFNGW